MINWFKNNHSYILLIVTAAVFLVTINTHISNITQRQNHFAQMEEFRNQLSSKLVELDQFKNRGERFTADDGRRHEAQIKELEQRLQKTVEIIQQLEREK